MLFYLLANFVIYLNFIAHKGVLGIAISPYAYSGVLVCELTSPSQLF